jgi:hypothetical protein
MPKLIAKQEGLFPASLNFRNCLLRDHYKTVCARINLFRGAIGDPCCAECNQLNAAERSKRAILEGLTVLEYAKQSLE